jgi:hypothetical protein
MKTTITSIFLLFLFTVKGQNCDVFVMPTQNTLVVSYNNSTPIGFYFGGFYNFNAFVPRYPQTSFVSRINRVGINLIDSKSTFSIMGGAFIETLPDTVIIKPDFWFKIYPLRTILNKPKGMDLVFAFNYNGKTNYGVGLSIGIRGIYR